MDDDAGLACMVEFMTQMHRVPADADVLYVLMQLADVLHKAGDILPDDARDHLLLAGAACVAMSGDPA